MRHIYLLPLFLLIPFGRMVAQDSRQSRQSEIDSLRNRIALTEGKEKLDAYESLSSLYWAEAHDEHKRDTLLAIYREYEAEAERQHNHKRRAGIKANILTMFGNELLFDEVIRRAPETIKELSEMGYGKPLYESYRALINAHRRKNESETALRYAQELYELARQRQDAGGMGIAFYSMSQIYRTQRRHDEVEKNLKECIALVRDSTSYLYLLADAYTQLGINYVAMGRYDDALKTAEELSAVIPRYEEASKSRKPSAWGMLYQIEADAYHMLKRWDEAEISLNRMDSIRNGTVPYYGLRAHILMGRGQYDRALEMIDKEKETVVTFQGREQAMTTKTEILTRMGRADEAMQEFNDLIAALNEEHNEQVSARLDEIRTQYEVDRHIAEKERNRNYFLFALGGCSLLVVALGIWIFYSRQIVRKNRGLYLQIREQDRLMKELKQVTTHCEQLAQSAPQALHEDPVLAEALPGTPQQRKLVARLHQYLLSDRNFANPDMVFDKLVPLLNTNRTYLYDSIKAVSGKSLQEYVNFLRLEEARRMFDNHSELTIERIAEECGFNYYSTFYRLFRERYQITPSEYRKMALYSPYSDKIAQ